MKCEICGIEMGESVMTYEIHASLHRYKEEKNK